MIPLDSIYRGLLWGIIIVSLTLLVSIVTRLIPSASKVPLIAIIGMALILFGGYIVTSIHNRKKVNETLESHFGGGVKIMEEEKLTFMDGFKFGLGFFTAGLVFYIIVLIITLMALGTLWKL
ncbi:hypothetical protein [Thermococcus litoralis]|uniref:hypothetical protein n=1 Tax=Thermococcus litoralis TaxID=2265 RepID=UPI00117C0BEE|nr:hypothetical protein [Thermococcus litoralis]